MIKGDPVCLKPTNFLMPLFYIYQPKILELIFHHQSVYWEENLMYPSTILSEEYSELLFNFHFCIKKFFSGTLRSRYIEVNQNSWLVNFCPAKFYFNMFKNDDIEENT